MSETNEALPYFAFGLNLTLTVLHLFEEYRGKLWRYFGGIAGVDIPTLAGKIFFTGGLGAILVAAAFGILDAAGPDPRYPRLSLAAVGFLIGGRISDWLSSHVLKRLLYKWDQAFLQNPGFLSSWFYLVDAAVLIYVLQVSESGGAANRLVPIGLGLLGGIMFFLIVIGTIRRIANKFFPHLLKPRWEKGQPTPTWM